MFAVNNMGIRLLVNMKNKKAMSAVVAVMLLIVIVLAGTTIIWKVVNKTVEEGLEGAKSCYDVLDKIEINSEYTCYDFNNKEMHVSVGLGDIEIENLFLVLTNEDSSLSFELSNELETITDLRNYNGTLEVKIPNKNAGTTFIASNVEEMPILIEVAPRVNGELCRAVDSFSEIYAC